MDRTLDAIRHLEAAITRLRADPDPDSDREAVERFGEYDAALDDALGRLLDLRLETGPTDGVDDALIRRLARQIAARFEPTGGVGDALAEAAPVF